MEHRFVTCLSFFLCLLILPACQPKKQNTDNNENEKFPLSDWVIEDESDSASFTFLHDTLEIVSPKGLTMWYNRELSGNYEISYSISLRMDGRKSDRLADMNCFWAASDPLHPDSLFFRSEERHGIFKNYNSLNLYYVGYGGNDNTTTRFRKYHGKFYGTEDDSRVKPLLQEYTDEKHLLKPNNWYNIVITVQNGVSRFSVNGEELFRLEDKEAYKKGYFGIRLLENRAQITAFSVEKL
ncbi:DUF6250 domain-containing protein [Coprobacter sp.]|uniref:DUF6250 domain-containing protein n=1 Tax=Coprobacter sp. TaxID=1941478 RepID=UPI003AB591DF